ncbi:kinase-like protein [Peniophora sp. CONT]|nr:kinase-like protein [Peniophora sp. CONT]
MADTLEEADKEDRQDRHEALYLRRIEAASGGLQHICKLLEDQTLEIASTMVHDLEGKPHSRSFAVLCIVLEYCEGGRLKDFIRWLGNKSLTESETRYFGRQIFQGLLVLHENNMIHRDLKTENILVRWTPDKTRKTPAVIGRKYDIRNWSIKIGDFGTVKQQAANEIGVTKKVGTSGWYPPELNAYGKGDRTHKSDIWTAGLVLVSLLTNDFHPKAGLRLKDIKVLNDHSLSHDCREVLKGFLQDAPKDRCAIAQALAGPWFSAPDSMYTVFPGLTDGDIVGPLDNALLTGEQPTADSKTGSSQTTQKPASSDVAAANAPVLDASYALIPVAPHVQSFTPTMPTSPLSPVQTGDPVLPMPTPDISALMALQRKNSDSGRSSYHSLFSTQSSVSTPGSARSNSSARSASARSIPGGRYGSMRSGAAGTTSNPYGTVVPRAKVRVNQTILEEDEEAENSMDTTA